MRINIIILIVTVLLGAGLTFWLDGSLHNGKPEPAPSPVIAEEKPESEKVPDFAFVDLSGKSHHIKDFKGQVVLIHFWATWCAPCVVEFPKLVKLSADHPDIVIIALSSDVHDDKIKNFLKKIAVPPSNFLIARDQKRKITTDIFQTFKLPETLIVSTGGTIFKKIVGDADWTGQDIENLLSSLKQ